MKHPLRFLLLAGLLALYPFFLSCETKENSGTTLDIGGERKMYLECQGTGSPTVVLISGRSDRSTIWHKAASGPNVYDAVAAFTHVCAYDRPGTVRIDGDNIEPSPSTVVPQPVTPKNAVEDLHALLAVAKVQGPFVLVAHSYGGLVARLYAATYPDEVVGLVLIDTLTEFLYDALNPAQQALWIRLNSTYSPDLDKYTTQERTDLLPTFEQLRRAPALRPMPATVLTTDRPFDFKALMDRGILPSDTPLDFGPTVFQAHLKGQEHLTQLLKAKHITQTHAGHYIQTEQPQMVIDAIKEVVDKIRLVQ